MLKGEFKTLRLSYEKQDLRMYSEKTGKAYAGNYKINH